MTRLKASARGFTLVEMLTAAVIIGLILLLIGYEFDAVLGHLLHTRANRDIESNARIAVNKVTNRLRTASPWVFNQGPFTAPFDVDTVIQQPIPASTPGTSSAVLQFYRVRPGSLSNAAAIPTPAPANIPTPPYDLVTIQRTTCPYPKCIDPSPNYLVETAVDALSNTPSEPPLVLARDVSNFLVTATGDPKGHAAQMDILLTVVTNDPKCNPHCSYTTESSVWVGGDQVNE
jgi:prepilin-type N-terminal cleavage/methylation domain-containing protein